MNTNFEVLSTLSKTQVDQQIDLAKRLMRLAVLGTPNVGAPSAEAADHACIQLALEALMTAYMALAEANTSTTGTAAAVAFSVAERLMHLQDQRIGAQQSAFANSMAAQAEAQASAPAALQG